MAVGVGGVAKAIADAVYHSRGRRSRALAITLDEST